jgi:hypothetical protein
VEEATGMFEWFELKERRGAAILRADFRLVALRIHQDEISR